MSREIYIQRINKVIDYVEAHYNSKFDLDELAKISNFSKFHFSRLFKSIVGETPFQLILRIRLEKAASKLIRSKDTISSIAYGCGFKSLPVFSKNFRNYYKQSATSYRIKNSNFNKLNSNQDKELEQPAFYFCSETRSVKWTIEKPNNTSIVVKELPEMYFVCVKHTGAYRGDYKLFRKLFDELYIWSEPKGLLSREFFTAVVYHDDAYVADESKLRISVCLSAQEKISIDHGISELTLKKSKCVVANFRVKVNEFQQAWDWLMGEWFPRSGYQPDDKPCFELYYTEASEGIYEVSLCVPLRRL